MIKSNFQLEKEKERSILDCITSITGKLDEATVVGFSAPMGGIANAQPYSKQLVQSPFQNSFDKAQSMFGASTTPSSATTPFYNPVTNPLGSKNKRGGPPTPFFNPVATPPPAGAISFGDAVNNAGSWIGDKLFGNSKESKPQNLMGNNTGNIAPAATPTATPAATSNRQPIYPGNQQQISNQLINTTNNRPGSVENTGAAIVNKQTPIGTPNSSGTPTQSAFNNNDPNWAKQRAKTLTNPVLPPLSPGQSTPFVAKGPFVSQGQGQQSTQSQSSMAATIPAGALPVATGSALQVGQQAAEAKGKDAWERARAGTFDFKNEVLPSANYDPVVINARKVLATPYETPSGQPRNVEQTLARARASSADTQDLLARGRDLIAKSQAGHERSVAARAELRQTMDNMPQRSKPSLPDINDLSPDELYRRRMAAGNFSGNSLSDTVDMKERAAQQTQAGGQRPVYIPYSKTPEGIRRGNLTPEQRATEDQTWRDNKAKAVAKDNERRSTANRQKQIDRVLQRGGILTKDQLSGKSDQFDLPEVPADRIRRRDEDETNSQQSTNSGGRGIVSSGRSGLGGGAGGSRLPESFNRSSSRLDEISGVGLGVGHAATVLLNKQIKDWSAAAAKNSIDYVKNYAPKVGYIVGTPPRELAASATGRLSGLGFSKEGALNRFNYYRQALSTGGDKAKGLIGFGSKLLGIPQAGKFINNAIDMVQPWTSAAADEAATLTGAALYDPRMGGMNFSTIVDELAAEENKKITK